MKITVSKTGQKSVPYSRKILVNNLLSTARAINLPDGQAKEIAELTANKIEVWLEKHTAVTTADIRRVAGGTLKKLNKDLAYIYINQRRII